MSDLSKVILYHGRIPAEPDSPVPPFSSFPNLLTEARPRRLHRSKIRMQGKGNQVKQFLFRTSSETDLYKTSLITTTRVIPAKAGIQKNSGFRVKLGMTDYTRLLPPCMEG